MFVECGTATLGRVRDTSASIFFFFGGGEDSNLRQPDMTEQPDFATSATLSEGWLSTGAITPLTFGARA